VKDTVADKEVKKAWKRTKETTFRSYGAKEAAGQGNLKELHLATKK